MGSKKVETGAQTRLVGLGVEEQGGSPAKTNNPAVDRLNTEFVDRVIERLSRYQVITEAGQGKGLRNFVAVALVINDFFNGNKNHLLIDEFEGSLEEGLTPISVGAAADYIIYDAMGQDIIIEWPFFTAKIATDIMFSEAAGQLFFAGVSQILKEETETTAPKQPKKEEEKLALHGGKGIKVQPLIDPVCLKDVDGHDVIPSQWIGKPTIIYHNATWCPYCEEFSGIIDGLAEKYGDKVNFVFLDELSSDEELLREQADKRPYAKFIYDSEEALQTFTEGVVGVPQMLIYDRSGKPIYQGHPNKPVVPNIIDLALKAAPVAPPEPQRCLRGKKIEI